MPSADKFLRYAFLAIMAVLLIDSLMVIFSPVDVRGVESNVTYTIQRILESNANLFENPEEPPYKIVQYSPIYYLISDGILTLLQVAPDNFYAVRIITRLLSAMFCLASAWLMFVFLGKHSRLSLNHRRMFTVFFLLFTYPWYFICRPDVLVIFGLMATIYLVKEYLDKGKIQHAFLLGVVSLIAFGGKQNGVMLFGLIGLFFLINWDWKAIFAHVLGFALSGALLLGVLYWGDYDLTFIKENIIDGVRNGIDWEVVLSKTYARFIYYLLPLFLFALYANLSQPALIQKPKRKSIEFFLLMAFVILFPFALLTGLKRGSAVNYFNESALILLIQLGLLFDQMKSSDLKRLFVPIMLILGIHQGMIHCINYLPTHGYFAVARAERASQRKAPIQFLKENLGDSYFFSDNRNLAMSMPDRCVLLTKEIHLLGYRHKIYDYSLMQDDFRSGKIKYLVLKHPVQESFLGMNFNDWFVPTDTMGVYTIYEHKSSTNVAP